MYDDELIIIDNSCVCTHQHGATGRKEIKMIARDDPAMA